MKEQVLADTHSGELNASPIDPLNPPDYVERSHEIHKVEREQYLRKRRTANNLPEPTDDNLTGLCISGGGVRSATLGLGMLQAFIKKGILKHFDYLSTVSGGGYIGSCLSSLLSAEPGTVDKAGKIRNENKRFRVEDLGLEQENSPFADLRKDYEYEPLEETVLSAKHQLHHLRRHGEYLTPNKSMFGWDVNRAFGAFTAGVVIHISLFLLLLATTVLVHHALFAIMSNDRFIENLQTPQTAYNTLLSRDPTNTATKADSLYNKQSEWAQKSSAEQLGIWFDNHLYPQIYLIISAVKSKWELSLLFLFAGGISGWLFLLYARRLPMRIARAEQEEQSYSKDPEAGAFHDRPGGEDLQIHLAGPFIIRFNILTYLLGPLLAYGVTIALFFDSLPREYGYFALLGLPFCFSTGLFLSVQLLVSLYFINNSPEQVSGRLYRSFYTGMQGATFIGLLITLLFPMAIILLFGKHGLAVRLLFSFLPVAIAYYFTMQTIGGRGGSGGLVSSIIRRLQMPLLNLSIFLFIGLSLAWVSVVLYGLEDLIQGNQKDGRLEVVLLMLTICSLTLVLLGFAANSNDISLHYFYRDRLTEAYLRTNGRVARQKATSQTGDKKVRVQSKELFDVNLRNHDSLRLADLGKDNFRGPYHLMVGALNLQGSNDPAKKTLKSDHFIFSKHFIGSRTTGYFRTDKYRGGTTKLNTAMAISAAAVASGMGMISFAASNFYMTLFNLRTGYWIENPWYMHKEMEEARLEKEGTKIKRTLREWVTSKLHNYPFWLWYLGREFTGKLSASTRRVYVSDGGHTGDNLGLLPLVQRRCSTIVIADFEEDGAYSFASFNQAVRLAKATYDVDFEIDLRNLMPQKNEKDGLIYSPASVIEGKIFYPKTKYRPAMTGRIVYMKSSVNLLQEASQLDSTDTPPLLTEPAPVFVLNYFKTNPSFPHQSTADQYFDEVQFEAYRMLGEHIGKQAVETSTLKKFKTESPAAGERSRKKLG